MAKQAKTAFLHGQTVWRVADSRKPATYHTESAALTTSTTGSHTERSVWPIFKPPTFHRKIAELPTTVRSDVEERTAEERLAWKDKNVPAWPKNISVLWNFGPLHSALYEIRTWSERSLKIRTSSLAPPNVRSSELDLTVGHEELDNEILIAVISQQYVHIGDDKSTNYYRKLLQHVIDNYLIMLKFPTFDLLLIFFGHRHTMSTFDSVHSEPAESVCTIRSKSSSVTHYWVIVLSKKCNSIKMLKSSVKWWLWRLSSASTTDDWALFVFRLKSSTLDFILYEKKNIWRWSGGVSSKRDWLFAPAKW